MTAEQVRGIIEDIEIIRDLTPTQRVVVEDRRLFSELVTAWPTQEAQDN